MKRVILFIVLVTNYWQSGAQGFMFKWSLGSNFPLNASAQSVQGIDVNTLQPGVDRLVNLANFYEPANTVGKVKGTYGAGFNGNLRFGYMFNPYIGVDIGASYTHSRTYSAAQARNLYLPDSTGAIEPTGAGLLSNLTTKADMLTLNPSVVAAYRKPGFKVYPYIRAGLLIPVVNQIQSSITIDATATVPGLVADPYFLGVQTSGTVVTEGNFAVGFNGAVGFTYQMLEYFSFFGEVTAQYLNTKATNSTITEWSADGNDLLPSRSIYRTRINYVDALNGASNNAEVNPAYKPAKPKQDISPAFPYSSVGFQIGVQLTISRKIWHDREPPEAVKKKKIKKKEDK